LNVERSSAQTFAGPSAARTVADRGVACNSATSPNVSPGDRERVCVTAANVAVPEAALEAVVERV
jgi:hypothetical protein